MQLDKTQIRKAVKCLQNHSEQQQSTNLLKDEHEFIFLKVVVNKIKQQNSLKPIPLDLVYPIYLREFNSQCCLIVKDPQREWKDMLLQYEELKDTPLAKIMSISKLGKNYVTFKDKSQLLNQYDLFLCDVRVSGLIPRQAGKIFFQRKRLPCSIEVTKEGILNAFTKTFLSLGNGPEYVVRVGRVSMNSKQVTKNILKLIPQIIPLIGKSRFVQAIELKTTNSMSLPIYNYISQEMVNEYLNKKKEEESKKEQ